MANLSKTALTLEEVQSFIKETCKERGWDKRPVEHKMLLLTEEVGEVAKALRKELQVGSPKPDNTDHLAEELIDVLNYLADIANEYDIDLDQAFRNKWQKNATRSWESSPTPDAPSVK
jgi:NTP pyrophosphatase (non-canonical NTP hydrolase)